LISTDRSTDSCGRVLTNYWFSSAYCQFINYRQQIEMTAKHRSVNNVLWRVVAGRIGRGHGRDAARQLDNNDPSCAREVQSWLWLASAFSSSRARCPKKVTDSYGLTSHSTQNRYFKDDSRANLLAWYGKNLNLTQQKHTFTSDNSLNVQHKN